MKILSLLLIAVLSPVASMASTSGISQVRCYVKSTDVRPTLVLNKFLTDDNFYSTSIDSGLGLVQADDLDMKLAVDDEAALLFLMDDQKETTYLAVNKATGQAVSRIIYGYAERDLVHEIVRKFEICKLK